MSFCHGRSLGLSRFQRVFTSFLQQELWTGLLAYNLIRQAMLQAAWQAGRLIAAQLASLTAPRVGNRPNRIEHRAVKRRPNPIALVTKPCPESRAELLVAGGR